MIETVEIRSWQSLRKLDLTLGRFTVVVGQSSSGKSALVRALKAVASNVRGTGVITRGATTAAITVRTGTAIVSLEHAGNAWRYRLIDEHGREETYTKLAGSVPRQVTDLLRINPVPSGGTSLNFAGQFDAPYLLGETGATVARVLGELTNVDTIFAAVREANRRRAAAAATLKTREADLAAARARLGRYTDLPARLAACQRAEQAADRASDLQARVDRLEAAVAALAVADTVLARSTPAPLPSLDRVQAAYERLSTFTSLAHAWGTAQQQVQKAMHDSAAASEAVRRFEQEIHDLLVTAGRCPTCLQKVVA